MGFRSAREAAGLTVRDVMDKLGVSDASVYQWEMGVTHPKGKRLVDVANLYCCSIDDLFDRVPPKAEEDWAEAVKAEVRIADITEALERQASLLGTMSVLVSELIESTGRIRQVAIELGGANDAEGEVS